MEEGWPPVDPSATFVGQYCSLVRLSMDHCSSLFEMMQRDAPRFAYLQDDPAITVDAHENLVLQRVQSIDPLFYAIVINSTGRIGGRLAYSRMAPTHGVVEIGHVYFGPEISRQRIATEAVFLMLQYAFDSLGYRRVEWKCNDANEASKRAAIRFGFRPEGVFRKHMMIKGQNRDTAWFAMTDDEWKVMKQYYADWLHESNFTTDGAQLRPLTRGSPA